MLATINTEAPVEFNAEELKVKQPNLPELLRIFEELEFRTFAKRIVSDYKAYESHETDTTYKKEPETKAVAKEAAPKELDLFSELSESAENSEYSLFSSKNSASSVQHDYKTVSKDKELDDLLNKLEKAEVYAVDINNDGISFCVKAHEAFYRHFEWSKAESRNLLQNQTEISPLPAVGRNDGEENAARNDEIIQRFLPIFENPAKTIIGHNLKSVIAILRRNGIELKNKLFDTMIAHYLIEPEQRHTMDYLADVYLNYTVTNNSAENADIAYQLYDHCYLLRTSSRKYTHQNGCSATTTPRG